MRTWLSIVLAVTTGTSGWFIVISVYLFSQQVQTLSSTVATPLFLVVPSVLLWLSVLALVRTFLGRHTFSEQFLISTGSYLLTGLVLLALAAAVRADLWGAILFLAPVWPVGVVFVLFSEPVVYDPQDLIRLFGVGVAVLLALGFLAGLFERLSSGQAPRLEPPLSN